MAGPQLLSGLPFQKTKDYLEPKLSHYRPKENPFPYIGRVGNYILTLHIMKDKLSLMAKYIFIDESGDPGFKLDKGSSNFFVIALVIFDDTLEIEKSSVAIKELKRNLAFPGEMEFKFSKSRDDVRKRFLNIINEFDFKIRSLVVPKKNIRSGELRNNKRSFYSYFIRQVLRNGGETITDARVRIDGSGDREFRSSFLTYLRKELNSNDRHVLTDLKFVDSRGSIPIQIADMVAGAIRRFYEGKSSRGFKNIIKKHIEDEWIFN